MANAVTCRATRDLALALAVTTAVHKDGREIHADGFFHGYTPWVWATISLQAFGGLVVAAVMRFGDNILKNFALGFSIMLSYGISIQLFGQPFSHLFGVGALLVIVATFAFNSWAPQGNISASKSRRTSMLMPGSTNVSDVMALAPAAPAKRSVSAAREVVPSASVLRERTGSGSGHSDENG